MCEDKPDTTQLPHVEVLPLRLKCGIHSGLNLPVQYCRSVHRDTLVPVTEHFLRMGRPDGVCFELEPACLPSVEPADACPDGFCLTAAAGASVSEYSSSSRQAAGSAGRFNRGVLDNSAHKRSLQAHVPQITHRQVHADSEFFPA
jgi:hypothetical protein